MKIYFNKHQCHIKPINGLRPHSVLTRQPNIIEIKGTQNKLLFCLGNEKQGKIYKGI